MVLRKSGLFIIQVDDSTDGTWLYISFITETLANIGADHFFSNFNIQGFSIKSSHPVYLPK